MYRYKNQFTKGKKKNGSTFLIKNETTPVKTKTLPKSTCLNRGCISLIFKRLKKKSNLVKRVGTREKTKDTAM